MDIISCFFGLNCVLPNSYVEALTLSTSEHDYIRDRLFK